MASGGNFAPRLAGNRQSPLASADRNSPSQRPPVAIRYQARERVPRVCYLRQPRRRAIAVRANRVCADGQMPDPGD